MNDHRLSLDLVKLALLAMSMPLVGMVLCWIIERRYK